MSLLSHWRSRLVAARQGKPLDGHETRCPAQQNAVDLFANWHTGFPPKLNLKAGPLALFDDARIRWMIDQLGGVSGWSVLELGPLEGAHTAILAAAGANVLAIESNGISYLKCLVFKEVLGVANARFLLGDFLRFLEETPAAYDVVVASGVLYHMRDPVRLLEAIARRTSRLYLWTHCIRDDREPTTVVAVHGVPVRLYEQFYGAVNSEPQFCGGIYDRPRWMHRDDILAVLGALGFESLTLAHETSNESGPCFSVMAQRPPHANGAVQAESPENRGLPARGVQ